MKKFLFFLLVLMLIGAGIGYYGYKIIFSPNVALSDSSQIITVPSGSSFEDLVKILEKEDVLTNTEHFRRVANWMKFGKSSVPPGKFEIKNNWSNRDLVGHLRSGRQVPVRVTFNNLRTVDELAGRISSYLEVDSASLLNYFNKASTLEKAGVNSANFITTFIPNTYEFYWNVSKEKLLERIISEKDKFWQKNGRAEKAAKLNMTKEEVITLASIVEKESLRKDEKPIIAGVYINRLRIGMPLQADPAVVFGLKAFDLRRVLNKHLEIDTPYNTYMHAGLPPGPICMPSISSIDGVLNVDDHKYLYFCAKPESNGGHLFAEDITQHNANARVYHRWLDSRGIR